MFEFGRDLSRRRSGADASSVFKAAGFRTSALAGGDRSLHELLDLSLLTAEAKSVARDASRPDARDPAASALRAAAVWRELARRTGDVIALRKAAAFAEAAAATGKGTTLSDARCEQAQCAVLGAELFGDDGLTVAAEHMLRLVSGSPLAGVLAAGVAGRRALASGDVAAVLAAARAIDAPLAALRALAQPGKPGREALTLTWADQVCLRADLMVAAGARLKDRSLIDAALRDLAVLRGVLDPAYAPLTVARLEALRGGALVLAGETSGDLGLVLEGIDLLTAGLELLPAEHSPLDWARLHAALAIGLQALGEATSGEQAFERAVTCFDRARVVLSEQPALQLTAVVANNRAICLARSAELTGDLAVLDAAEAALKTELMAGAPRKDPVAWAIVQVNLARLYEARIEITGKDRGERAKAAMALATAFDVFAEEGLRSLSDMASAGLERLRAGASA